MVTSKELLRIALEYCEANCKSLCSEQGLPCEDRKIANIISAGLNTTSMDQQTTILKH
jgi:hypothetical protein